MRAKFVLFAAIVSAVAMPAACAQAPAARWKLALAATPAPAPADAATAYVERHPPPQPPDPCLAGDVASNPTRPNWSNGAATTQCGVVEIDSGWLLQTMGGGVAQRMQVTSLRYGVGPRLDVRWATPGPILQSGGGTAPLNGISDQWFTARYRFLEQGTRGPAMAFSYSIKNPEANPAKGFGTGYVDHQLLLIASRDFGRTHFDFNAQGLLAGSAQGFDGAARFGLAMTVTATRRLSAMLESDGGALPGVPDRFGEALAGASWTMNPRWVIDAAYTRAYTAGAPRQQFTLGCTYAFPSRMVIPASRHEALRRMMGR